MYLFFLSQSQFHCTGITSSSYTTKNSLVTVTDQKLIACTDIPASMIDMQERRHPGKEDYGVKTFFVYCSVHKKKQFLYYNSILPLLPQLNGLNDTEILEDWLFTMWLSRITSLSLWPSRHQLPTCTPAPHLVLSFKPISSYLHMSWIHTMALHHTCVKSCPNIRTKNSAYKKGYFSTKINVS